MLGQWHDYPAPPLANSLDGQARLQLPSGFVAFCVTYQPIKFKVDPRPLALCALECMDEVTTTPVLRFGRKKELRISAFEFHLKEFNIHSPSIPSLHAV